MITKTKANPNSNRGRRNLSNDSFLEALRDLGGGIVQEAKNQITGSQTNELKPNQPLDLENLKKQETKEFLGFSQDFLDIRHQEKLVWSRKQQETELQIQALIIELNKLTQITTGLAKEVKIAAEQVPVEPGVYHLTFFEKLRQTILLFKQHVEQAASWLSASNQKAKKRNYYWSQFRKSGTKFMLSQERYMATQAG